MLTCFEYHELFLFSTISRVSVEKDKANEKVDVRSGLKMHACNVQFVDFVQLNIALDVKLNRKKSSVEKIVSAMNWWTNSMITVKHTPNIENILFISVNKNEQKNIYFFLLYIFSLFLLRV